MKYKYVGKVPRIINNKKVVEGDIVELKQEVKNENFEKISTASSDSTEKKSKKKDVKKNG